MLTTTDNPYDPFASFDEWYVYDTAKGYCTLAFLARMTRSSDELPLLDQLQAIEIAIDEIVEENITGLYKKISTDIEEPLAV